MRLKKVMEVKNVSVSKLARLSGLSESYIRLLLAGKKSPTIRTLEKLATALEVTIRDLLDEPAKAVGE